jgi:hypothetical protein
MLRKCLILNSKGSTFIWILVTVAVLSILGISILNIGVANTRQTIYQEKQTKAHYAARAGVEAVFADINADRSDSNIISLIDSNPFGDVDADSGIRYETQIIPLKSNFDILKINSTGYVGDNISKQISLKISRAENYFVYAMFGDISMGLGGSSNTEVHNGDVATNANTHTGNLTFVPSGNEVQHNVNHVLEPIKLSMFASASSFVPNDEINMEDYTVINDPDDGTPMVFLETNSIILSGNKNIVFNGEGEFHLLVKNTFDIGGSCSITTAEGTKLFIYFQGANMIIGGTIDIDGVIYAPNAEFRVNGGGNAVINGAVNAKSINMNGGVIELHYISDLNSDVIDKTFRRIIWTD